MSACLPLCMRIRFYSLRSTQEKILFELIPSEKGAKLKMAELQSLKVYLFTLLHAIESIKCVQTATPCSANAGWC